MTHKKANKSKILALILGLTMCISLMLGIVFASPTNTVYAAGEDGTAPTIVKTGGIDVDREDNMGNLPNALKGVEYKAKDGSNYKIEATGDGPFTYFARTGEGYGAFPKGLSLNPTTGEIVGTPEEAGTFGVSITVSNKFGRDNVLAWLRVYEETDKPQITTTEGTLPDGYVDSSYFQWINFTDNTGNFSTVSITKGKLPDELEIKRVGVHAAIDGTPTTPGHFTFTVRVENSLGFDEKTYTITIEEGYQRPEIINKNDIRNEPAIKGKYFEFQFVATGTNTAANPFLFFTYVNQSTESTPNAQGEYELGNGLFLTKEGKVYGTPVSTGSITVHVGVKTKNLYDNYNDSGFGNSYCYFEVYENGQITGITVSPENTSVPKGGKRQFTATVTGYGDFDKSVTWEIYGGCSSAGTSLSQDGVLTVGIDETEKIIGVRATSKDGTSKDIPVTIIDHTHTTTLVPATPKTCTTDGNKKHFKCNVCGDLFADAGGVNSLTEEDVKEPAGHDYTQMVGLVSPTCSSKGMKAHFRCHNCDKYFELGSYAEVSAESLEIDIDPNAHNTTHKDGSEANCSVTGIYPHEHCSLCNKNFYSDGVTEMTDIVKPKNDNHDWNAWVSNGNGTHTRTCKRDSSHKENGTCSGGTATCTIKAVCEVCRTTYGDTAPHTYGELIPEVPATTTEFGVKEHKDCKVCGKHFDKDGNEITELKIAKIGTHNVVINGESKFYKEGESVTVTAEDKEGKEFKGWKDGSGKIVSTEKSYTFKVTGETTLTAVYEDKASGGGEITPTPDKKDGLSGGAIAGIVIGSVAVAGIGGFAIFWFAVKKKTFADLGVALKKGFTVIGNFFKSLGEKIKALFTKKK